MFLYDAELAAAVAAPPRTIADVQATMERIDALTLETDGLKWFNWLYLEVTRAVKNRVAAAGFGNVDWLSTLDVEFAKLYFAALTGWIAGQSVPHCWRVLFDRRNQGEIARIQFALAGINAHINHDLALAIGTTCAATRTTPDHGSPQYRDYCGVNTTLDGLVELAKGRLMLRLAGDALPPISHLEDTVAAWKVAAARELAWRNAETLWHIRQFPSIRSRWLEGLDGITTVAGKALLVPVPVIAA
jgi:hypothetical protein